jgi:hypothetical protein
LALGEALPSDKQTWQWEISYNQLHLYKWENTVIYQSMQGFSTAMLDYQRVQLDSFWFGWFLGMFDHP